jgi:hypothetical protein
MSDSDKSSDDRWHLQFSIGKALWDDLARGVLPMRVQTGPFHLSHDVYRGLQQLGVKQKVSALLEDRQAPAVVMRARDSAAAVWKNRRSQVYTLIEELIRVEGNWEIYIDDKGTEFIYGDQRIELDAHVKAVVSGKAYFLRENVELPFAVTKRIGASAAIAEIHYDKAQRSVVGKLADPAVDLGDHFVLRLLNDGVRWLIQQNPQWLMTVPLIPKDQLDEMLAPAGGPLKLKMGVDDIRVDVDKNNVTLKVRFGFTQLQLEG